MTIKLAIILVIILMLILFMYYIEPRISKQKLANKNEHGSARWSTFNEIKKNFKKNSLDNIKSVGYPVWFSKDLKYVWWDYESPHHTYLGSSGSGKSSTSVLPLCSFIANSKEKRSVFITDPKAEIFNKASKMFQDNGFEIITLDFRSPELSNKINLLEPSILEYEKYMDLLKQSQDLDLESERIKQEIIKLEQEKELLSKKRGKRSKRFYEIPNLIENENQKVLNIPKEQLKLNNKAMSHYAESNRLVTSLSLMIMQEKETKDPFWNNSAKNLLEGIIGMFLEDYKDGKIKREQITLSSVKKFQNSSMTESNFKRFKLYIEKKPYGSASKDKLISILSTSENTYKSITSVFNEKMSLFDDVNVENITSSSDFDFDILGKKASVLFFIVPDEDKIYFTLISIIIGLLYRELVKLANSREDKKIKVGIDFILDEFANCPPLPDIETIVSVARSRNMRFHFYIQSFAQLDNVYGKDTAQIILDNCALTYLKTNTQETAEAISKRLGNKTIESGSVNYSISLTNASGSKSSNLMGRPLLTADEIKQLHYKTIIFPIVGYPVFRDTIFYKKFNCFKEGKIERSERPLQKLNDTYYTVEQINTFSKTNKNNGNIIDMTKEKQKNILDELLNKLMPNIKSVKKNISFYENDNTVVALIEFEKLIPNNIINKMYKQVDQNKFAFNIHIGDKTEQYPAKIEIFLDGKEKGVENNNDK